MVPRYDTLHDSWAINAMAYHLKVQLHAICPYGFLIYHIICALLCLAQLQVTRDGNEEIRELVNRICKETLPAAVQMENKQADLQKSHVSDNPRLVGTSSQNPSKRPFTSYENLAKEYPRAGKVDIQFTERTAYPKDGFCSPLTPLVKTWNTKKLFSKRQAEPEDVVEIEHEPEEASARNQRETRSQKCYAPVQERQPGTYPIP
jgi:hypothetical protein